MEDETNGRGPPMEDILKILKVKYLTHHGSHIAQILNFCSGDQTKKGKAENKDEHKRKMT